LLFDLFDFSPQLVAEGCDDTVEAYEIAREDGEKVSWRHQEVTRLKSTLSEQGRLGNLPPLSLDQSPCSMVAPSQFYVKATFLGCAAPAKRRAKQESVQQELLDITSRAQIKLASACIRGSDCVPSDLVVVSVTNSQTPLQRCLSSLREHFCFAAVGPRQGLAVDDVEAAQSQGGHRTGKVLEGACTDPEIASRHIPELCSECIRVGTWCSGTLHLPDITACLDGAAASMHSSARWSPCEAGLEAEVELEGERLLLQIRPRLFFIPEIDVKLFG
jgi:hypothetical protein